MRIRAYTPADEPAVLALTVEVFEPFHEASYRPAVGEVVFANRDGSWREDYRELLATIHAPGEGHYAALAVEDEALLGYVGWTIDKAQRHGEIVIVGVAADARGRGVGKALCTHAFERLRADGAEVVSIGTGGDEFHAPARALYESLGCTPFPLVNYTLPL